MTRTVLITGASSGIGRALALHYARNGGVLALMGRDSERLESVAAACREQGAVVHGGLIDVRNRNAMAEWISAFDAAHPLDLVIANAGVMAGTRPDGSIEPADAGYTTAETNLLGVLNTVQPLIAPMMARRRGQIALVSSIAGLLPLPDSPSYSASKAAVLTYGLSLRPMLEPYGIGVSVICPGYVRTPMMMRERGSKPMVMAPEKAADLIAAGLRRNRAVIRFPYFFAAVSRLLGLLPSRLRLWLLVGSRFTVVE
jgi:short-subunit dehydrogenase